MIIPVGFSDPNLVYIAYKTCPAKVNGKYNRHNAYYILHDAGLPPSKSLKTTVSENQY